MQDPDEILKEIEALLPGWRKLNANGNSHTWEKGTVWVTFRPGNLVCCEIGTPHLGMTTDHGATATEAFSRALRLATVNARADKERLDAQVQEIEALNGR